MRCAESDELQRVWARAVLEVGLRYGRTRLGRLAGCQQSGRSLQCCSRTASRRCDTRRSAESEVESGAADEVQAEAAVQLVVAESIHVAEHDGLGATQALTTKATVGRQAGMLIKAAFPFCVELLPDECCFRHSLLS